MQIFFKKKDLAVSLPTAHTQHICIANDTGVFQGVSCNANAVATISLQTTSLMPLNVAVNMFITVLLE